MGSTWHAGAMDMKAILISGQRGRPISRADGTVISTMGAYRIDGVRADGMHS